MGLEAITSSRDTTFMEAAAPIEALAPGVNAGIQIGRGISVDLSKAALSSRRAGAGWAGRSRWR